MLKRLTLLMVLLLPMLAGAATFVLTDMRGQTHTLAGHQGKWVLVNLWATWCPSCLNEMPDLETLSQARSDLVVLGVAADGQDARRIRQFIEKLHVTYPIVAGNAEIAAQFKPKGYPTSILYGPDGAQVLVKEGLITREQVEAVLNRRNGN